MNKIAEIKRAILRIVDKLREQKYISDLAKDAAEIIRKRTRLGFGVGSDGAPRHKLPALKPSYVRQRERFRRLSGNTRPGKSNLTRTGQLLDSLRGRYKSKGKGEVYVQSNRDDGKTNDEIAFHVSGKRPFAHLSNSEINQLKNKVRKDLKAEVNKILQRIKR